MPAGAALQRKTPSAVALDPAGSLRRVAPATHRALEEQVVRQLQHRALVAVTGFLQRRVDQVHVDHPALQPRFLAVFQHLDVVVQAERTGGEDQQRAEDVGQHAPGREEGHRAHRGEAGEGGPAHRWLRAEQAEDVQQGTEIDHEAGDPACAHHHFRRQRVAVHGRQLDVRDHHRVAFGRVLARGVDLQQVVQRLLAIGQQGRPHAQLVKHAADLLAGHARVVHHQHLQLRAIGGHRHRRVEHGFTADLGNVGQHAFDVDHLDQLALEAGHGGQVARFSAQLRRKPWIERLNSVTTR
ncbi:hypothetical protein G6F31_015233 [Rhizopus arrhizus]|nr:hypothetical protein G6F31_015233 [Rhizopus arrhizus]